VFALFPVICSYLLYCNKERKRSKQEQEEAISHVVVYLTMTYRSINLMMETSLLKLVYFIKEMRLLCENAENSKYLDKLEKCGFVLKLPYLVHEFNSVAREINND